ncbi:MAG TPA: tetratricopeptide repeat protein, partial [Prolixibacteraceae bacterium]
MKKYLVIFIVCMFVAVAYLWAQDAKMTVTTSSDKALALYNRAMSAMGNAELDTVNQFMNEAFKEDPDFFMGNARLALMNLYVDNQPEFKKYAENAVNSKAQLSKGETIIKSALEQLLQDPKADVTDLGNSLIELYPDDESAYYFQAQFQNIIKDYQESIKTYDALLKVTKNPGPVYNQMGYIYMNMGNFEAAQNAFDKYIELVPNHPNPYDSKGDYFMAVKDYTNAYASYTKAHQINQAWSYDKALKAKALM